MFDPHKENLTRKQLCAIAGWTHYDYGNLKKAGNLPFFDNAGDASWLRISAVGALVASGMTKLAKESADYSELSWKSASRIAYAGKAAAECVLRNRYGSLTDANAESILGSPWADRGEDLWCGYARTIDERGDEGGLTLPCGTLSTLVAKIRERSGGKDPAPVIKLVLLNYSQILADADARARAHRIVFPVLDDGDED